jgi:hypothetical protein
LRLANYLSIYLSEANAEEELVMHDPELLQQCELRLLDE